MVRSLAALLALLLTLAPGCGSPEKKPAPAGQPIPQEVLVITNGSAQPLIYVYVSSSAQKVWGPDLLEVDVLYTGEEAVIPLDPGSWDVKCVMQDGQEMVFTDLEVIRGEGDLFLTVEDEPQGEQPQGE